MNRQYIKIITAISIVALLSVQGIWLSNTYNLLNEKLIAELEEGFARSIEREVFMRREDFLLRSDRPRRVSVPGANPEKDYYTNALYFNEFFLSLGHPFSLERLDSLWSKKLADDIGLVKYLLQKTDSTGATTEKINRGASDNSPYTMTIERPIRIDNSEHLRVVIESPFKIVLRDMLVLLAISFLIALILGYCLYLQIRMIIRQGRIAEIRQDFTHAMVHDMKNPVANILMSVKALKSGKLDTKIQMKEKYFDIILKDGNRLLAFTNKILRIAQFEEYKIGLEKIDLDLKELVDNITGEYLLSPSKEVRFTTDIADDVIVHADPVYIIDAFRNLIDNSIKYSKETVEIMIRAKKQKNDTIIQIKDNGMGISQQDQKRIFNKFERTRSDEKLTKDGFGLGLFYVYQVVKAHGGSVKVESIPDVFCEFIIRIPMQKI